jgi:CBS domain-containing protein
MQSVRQMLEAKGRSVYAVAPSDTVYAAIKCMAERGVGALVVLDQGKLVGILSERDYARKVILLGKSSKDTTVAEIMTSPVLTTTLDARANACMRLMTDMRIRHLPVEENGAVIGMLSIGDLLKVVITDQQKVIEQLNSYINS